MKLSNDTIKWMRDEIAFSERQAKSARETEARQMRAVEEARGDAEWHDRRAADLTAVLEHAGVFHEAESRAEGGEQR